MAETGDWVTPRLYGKPWFEKPPLYYWGAARLLQSFRCKRNRRTPAKRDFCAPRNSRAGVAGIASLRRRNRSLATSASPHNRRHDRLLPRRRHRHAFQRHAHHRHGLRRRRPRPHPQRKHSNPPANPVARPDSLRLFPGLSRSRKGPRRNYSQRRRRFFLGTLHKTLARRIPPFSSSSRRRFLPHRPPLVYPLRPPQPDFFRIFIIEHNFKRFLTPEFQHIQPFWFYIPVLLVAFLPWTLFLLCSAFSWGRNVWRTREISASSCFLLCWAGFCVLFFTISRSKLPGYVLPAVPAIGALLARELSRRLTEGLGNARWVCAETALAFVAMGVAAEFEGRKIPFVTDMMPRTHGESILRTHVSSWNRHRHPCSPTTGSNLACYSGHRTTYIPDFWNGKLLDTRRGSICSSGRQKCFGPFD